MEVMVPNIYMQTISSLEHQYQKNKFELMNSVFWFQNMFLAIVYQLIL
jgi:hypothetical protein